VIFDRQDAVAANGATHNSAPISGEAFR